MGQHAPHRVLEVACSRRRSQQEVSMIELLKASRITSSQSAAGTGPQGISKAALMAVQELAARQALLDRHLCH
jgi:hypothetical protein